jgi:superfamily II DNA or RNA helicase
MPTRTSQAGSELFIVDNSDEDWKVRRYLNDWCQISKRFDIATGYFEIGSLLSLDGEWQKLDKVRILMGNEVTMRTRTAFEAGLAGITDRLDASLESEKTKNDFLRGVPAIAEAIRSGKIECRVFRKAKFHAKAYITSARLEVVGAAALVGSSNFTYPGLHENIELNVQITGRPVAVLQEWFEEHWQEAEPVSLEILRVIERHIRDFSPFEVYVRALQELFRKHELTISEWEHRYSTIFPILDQYQKEGYYSLIDVAGRHGGAFLCDGVGLGKTYVGLMLIERLVVKEKKRVLLLVPKSGRVAVWERKIRRHLPALLNGFLPFRIYNHTDLMRCAQTDGRDFPEEFAQMREQADVILIDEAHHFRNRGLSLESGGSRYWKLHEICAGKQMYMLTATPVNNHLRDLKHLIQLFTQDHDDHFARPPLGIHSLNGHFLRLEKALDQMVDGAGLGDLGVDMAEEASRVLWDDSLFRELVVQRSRAYVRRSQLQHGGTAVVFPKKAPPQVAAYSVRKTYGRILDMVELAFAKNKPLFSLAVYYPMAYRKVEPGKDEAFEVNRQKQLVRLIRIQFLKRFESSVRAFEDSCQTLLLKLLGFLQKNVSGPTEERRLERWKGQNADVLGRVTARQVELLEIEAGEENDDFDPVEQWADAFETLDRDVYKVDEIFDETYLDLEEAVRFLQELAKFKPSHDDKLKALLKLLTTDPVLKEHKVLVFSEYSSTARYLRDELTKAGIKGIDETDSGSKRDRADTITRFAPYYNESSSAELAKRGVPETRVLISTDVLSEGLNLQDATRLINYDIHWNPVRLMQRIGRVDRRFDPAVEKQIVADHPEQAPLRGQVAYWNFLPPDELEMLLRLYGHVSRKTLRISKVFGIEGRKLLTPEDDFEALKDFLHDFEGQVTPMEDLHLEYQKLVAEHPDLADRLAAFPNRVFSGRAHPQAGTQAVFFCFVLPAPEPAGTGGPGKPKTTTELAAEEQDRPWTEEVGAAQWYLYGMADGKIEEQPEAIARFVRSTPETPRRCAMTAETLGEIRTKIEKHIKQTYLRKVQAPVGVRPVLKCWMELN